MLILVKKSTIVAFFRLITGTVEIICAALIYRSRSPKTILKLSALLGVLGPLVLLGSLIIGVTSLKVISPLKAVALIIGALLIILGSSV